MAPPGAAEEGARSRRLRRPTTTMPGGGRAVKTGRTRPWPMPLGSRDGMSKARQFIAGAERMESAATKLPIFPCLCGMVIPVGPGVLSLRPPCFQQLRLALSQSATLTSGPARCPRRARHWQRAATLCRQHPVLACRHGRNKLFQIQSKKHGLWPCLLLWIRQLPIFP